MLTSPEKGALVKVGIRCKGTSCFADAAPTTNSPRKLLKMAHNWFNWFLPLGAGNGSTMAQMGHDREKTSVAQGYNEKMGAAIAVRPDVSKEAKADDAWNSNYGNRAQSGHDGRVGEDLLHLVVEIKGYRREDAKEKKSTMENYWVPGVNNLKQYGRWAFAEFTGVYQIEADFEARIEAEFNKMIEGVVG